MIFYFTGTGNSQMVAETIARSNGDTLVNIAAAMKAGNTPIPSAAMKQSALSCLPITMEFPFASPILLGL